MRKPTIAALCVLSLGHAMAAKPAVQDFPKAPLQSYECEECAAFPRNTLTTSWALPDKPLRWQQAPKRVAGKSWRKIVSMSELRAGVTFHTNAPGAVIRISPQKVIAGATEGLTLKTPDGKELSLAAVSDLMTTVRDPSARSPHPEQTIFSLDKATGHGRFEIRSANGDIPGSTQYVMHVYDKFSPTALYVETNKESYLAGEEIVVRVDMEDDGGDYEILDYLDVGLRAPDGTWWPMEPKETGKGLYEARMKLPDSGNSHGHHWYVEAFAESYTDEDNITRAVHAAFSYVIPSATVLRMETVDASLLEFEATTEAATASRYGLQAVLFGSDGKGKRHPVAVSQTAFWMEPGTRKVRFRFDNLPATPFGPPWFVGYLQLTDYGQYKPVFRFAESFPVEGVMKP